MAFTGRKRPARGQNMMAETRGEARSANKFDSGAIGGFLRASALSTVLRMETRRGYLRLPMQRYNDGGPLYGTSKLNKAKIWGGDFNTLATDVQ